MNRISGTVLAALAVLLALYVAYCSGNRNGARTALANQRDIHDDSTVIALRNESVARAKAFDRARDSTGRVIQNLQRRIKGVVPSANPTPDTSSGKLRVPGVPVARGASASVCAGAPAQCDTLISALTAGRQQDSLQLLFWKGMVAARDSLIPKLQAARDDWKRQSQRRFACVGGPAVAVGLNGRGAVGIGVACGWLF